MRLKPFSATALLRQNSPRKFSSNPFAQLRDESPAPGNGNGARFRSPSVKRKPEDSASYSAVVNRNILQESEKVSNCEFLEQLSVNMAKVTSLREKVQNKLVTLGAEPEICTIFNDLCEAIRCINVNQGKLAEKQFGEDAPVANFVQVQPKRLKQTTSQGNTAPVLVDITKARVEVVESKEEEELCKYREAVKEAEKATLI